MTNFAGVAVSFLSKEQVALNKSEELQRQVEPETVINEFSSFGCSQHEDTQLSKSESSAGNEILDLYNQPALLGSWW